MKDVIRCLAFAATLVLLLSCSAEKNCTITGSVSVPDASQTCQAVLFDADTPLDSCRIDMGSFVLHTPQNPEKSLRIEIHDASGKPLGDGGIFNYVMEIVADTGKMRVNLDDSSSEGSPLTQEMSTLLKKLDGIFMEPGDGDPMQLLRDLTRNTYLAHTRDAVGLQALRLHAGLLEEKDAEALLELLAQGADFIQEDEKLMQSLLFLTASQKETGAAEYVRIAGDGTVVSRESVEAVAACNALVGQGEWVLLDFWASWCGPCREETPNVIRLARKYGDKGLKVVGVTMKDKPEKSLEAIRQLGICYDQIFDLESIICNRFSIQGVPHFFLLDPEGNTVLQGHHNLDRFDAYLQLHL